MKVSLEFILERAKNADKVIIVGSGKRGRELLLRFYENSIFVEAFFDNNISLINSKIDNIKILRPHKIKNGIVIYVIAVDEKESQEKLFLQLQSLGIVENNIMVYDHYDYISNLDEKYYADELQRMFVEKFGRKIDWKNPTTYNEKINCDKLNSMDETKTKLADKFLVRDWVKEKIGEKYLNKIYGVWSNVDEIDFDLLPASFVLKMNNGSGRNIIVKDKTKINQKVICAQLEKWMKKNYAFSAFELQYKDIIPRIICEEYLEGVAEDVYDYNIYCFHGEPEYIWCIKGSHRQGCKASFYNKNWEIQPFSYGYPKDEDLAPKPMKLEEMLNLSRVLSKDFKHVRVDWYNLPDGRVLFGEMTFTTWAGLQRFEPDEYDVIWGNLI